MGRLTHRTRLGRTYLGTTKCAQSVSILQVKENAEILIAKLLKYRDKENYLLRDFVMMENRLHLILTPSQSTSVAPAIYLIKGGGSRTIHAERGTYQPILQSGFHKSGIKDLVDCKSKTACIRFNPVTAKLLRRPELCPYGSASGQFRLHPIPQGSKPHSAPSTNVGTEAPAPLLDFLAGRLARAFKPRQQGARLTL